MYLLEYHIFVHAEEVLKQGKRIGKEFDDFWGLKVNIKDIKELPAVKSLLKLMRKEDIPLREPTSYINKKRLPLIICISGFLDLN